MRDLIDIIVKQKSLTGLFLRELQSLAEMPIEITNHVSKVGNGCQLPPAKAGGLEGKILTLSDQQD